MTHEPPNSTDWDDDELQSAVSAYLDMLHMELDGKPFNKAAINRSLRAGPIKNRTKGSIEFRMQNISAVMYEMRMPRISGYLPAMQVGTKNKEKIRAALLASGVHALSAYVPTSNLSQLDKQVDALRHTAMAKTPAGTGKPVSVTVTTTSFVRDPAVKAWVLKASNGICEGCNAPAPFQGQGGFPFLEVHHVLPLVAHGSDTISNAVALCPNCHRRCHYSADRDEFKLHLYETIARLKVEVSFSPDIGDIAELD